MKLSPALRKSLVGNNRAQGDMVDDACELLTGQIVLWLKAKGKTLVKAHARMPPKSAAASLCIAQASFLADLIVELAEKS